MSGLLLLLLVIISFIFLVTWVIPKLLAWYFERKFTIAFRIGRIGLPSLKLFDVQLTKNGYTIHIDEISIKSSFLNSDITKLVTLVVKDVRVNKDIGNPNSNFDLAMKSDGLDFRERKVPHFVTTFAQFMAIHVYNISVMLLHSATPEYLIHATACEMHLDGSLVQNARTLLVNIDINEATAKILQHPEKQNELETCLAEINFAYIFEATLVAQGPLSVEKVHTIISQTNMIIHDGFYNLIQNNYKTDSIQNVECKEDIGSVIERIKPIIPKNLIIKIEDTSLKGVRKNGHTDFNATQQIFLLNYRTLSSTDSKYKDFSHIYLNFKMCDMKVQNSKDKLLILNNLALDAKVENSIVNLYLKLDTLLMTYDHATIHKWLLSNFLSIKKPTRKPLATTDKSPTAFETILSAYTINGCAEFCKISALIKLDSQNSSVGFNHAKVILEQASECRGETYKSYLPRVLLSDRHWQTELLVESLRWTFRDRTYDAYISKRSHMWGTPLYLGMALVKFETMQNVETKVESLLDTLQMEWSVELAKYILLGIKCIEEYDTSKYRNPVATSYEKSDLFQVSVTLALTHCNFFFSSEFENFVIRLNSVSIEKTLEITKANFKETKLFTISNTNVCYNCIRSEDISDYIGYMKTMRMEYCHKNKPKLSVNLLEEITGIWSTNVHLKAYLLIKDISEFLGSLKMTSFGLNKAESKATIRAYNFSIYGSFAFNIRISEKHSAKIALDNFTASSDDKFNLTLTNHIAVVSIDSADIFTIQGLSLRKIPDSLEIREERNECENFELRWNDPFELCINSFRAQFPHEHNYAEAVQSEFVSVFKWLKILHKRKQEPFTADSPLPKDLFIKVKEFLFEMSDDPFEVKLRDNFELLVDEYNESLKRQKMLKEKISELTKTHLHLPAGKVEELYASLKKKNAEIYIQRSKQMAIASPVRTRLFAWNMTDVEIMILADPSIHGTGNVIRVMREIDPDSPWPDEGADFSILWCRVVSLRCKDWKFQLRDFPQPLLYIHQCYICGQLVGAEQLAPRRAKRSAIVELGTPFEPFAVERSMLPLKFYHDFNCEIKSFSYAFGPCWEPVIAQCNLSFEKISAPSKDPSPPLSFWDRMRLLLHGRLMLVVQQMTVLLHASLDPYNTTEEMELTWNQAIIYWTNAKYVFKGDLNIFVRTASKYDDCQLLHMPNLKLVVGIKWLCLGDPNDHHNVIQCAPDKIPEYSSNQVHDSFRAFRSQNVNLSIGLETIRGSSPNQSPNSFDCPVLLLYGSTLRWFENLKLILSGVTRPTKRGVIFGNVRPRKIQLSRHYKNIRLLMGLHKFQVCYWMSFAMQRGCELIGGILSSTSEHTLSLNPIEDGLKHRPKAEWSVMYMTSELNDSEIWLKSALQENADEEMEAVSLRQPVEKCFCLSVAKVSYYREAVMLPSTTEQKKDTPTHRLVVYDLRGAWTKSNRNVAFALFDTFIKNKQMKKNLSTEALKGFRKDANTTPLKRRNVDVPGTPPNQLHTNPAVQDTPSSVLNKLQSGHAANMLQQLIAEAENKPVVYSDDLSSATRQQQLQGVQACQEDDVQHKNWHIALVNAQVLLKGCETKGYVILSAAKAEINQRIHRPVWKDRTLVSKTTWIGKLECMQYYATVNAGENDSANENIMWLTVDNIQEKDTTEISEPSEVPNLVGSGVSVGAVVSDTVGASSDSQLQRIVSRCKCEFFYASYGDISVDLAHVGGELPPPPQEDVSPWDRRQTAVDAFTLMHYDLNVCTNSLQYAMLLDIVNNLLLYVEPHRKEALERLARMRFQLQLHSVEDQRRPIQNQQTLVRSTVSKLRRLEKETYLVSKALAEEPSSLELKKEMERLEHLVYECKNQLNAQSEELDMMLSCYKETQLLANSRLATTRSDKPLTVVRANEICFKQGQWRLTEADGQIGIADLLLSNFLYTKNSKSDDSVEHLLELGYLRMTNLLPNEIYKEVLCPTEIQFNMPVEHKRVVRIFCRERPPVGGISVKEHFEINVVPLTIGLTKKFYNTMLKFCFPERDPDNIEYGGERSEETEAESKGKKLKSRRSRDSNFYVPIDDVEKMKERAEKNKLFVYIKIPEVPVRVSYKGNKEKNLEDLRDISLIIPTLEYHNMTWTWLDLLMAIRNDSRRVILSQAIKQKLQIKRNTGSSDKSSSPQEEDKATMLFGTRHLTENKGTKKGVTNMFKFTK